MNAFMFAHFGIIEFWTFLLGTIFIVLLPGPNSMYVLSAAGVSSLLKASPVLFYVVKSIGAAYLAWIGLQMLRGAVRNWRARKAGGSAEQNAARGDESHPFKKALVISLLNPKAILFFISFFIQFVDPHFALPALSFVVLGLVCQIGSFLYLTTIIFVGARLAAAFRARRRLAAGMSSGVGAMFIGFSAKLATATLN
ncbi:leucine efflux protein LeuE [Ralstonia pseudosolanacearum]|uniref:leucine efflux protein LeuE n=1 Tax=Ralstonia pseudosolanacearum TaxID=1310165 RepID=UPI0020055AD8|nr:leucine efflux protein LeuE [Ralstonia pseudosolanacearum]MCK4154168.1 leucine efflux protein LeuE [Ralstonia pseudosolanacearum]